MNKTLSIVKKLGKLLSDMKLLHVVLNLLFKRLVLLKLKKMYKHI